MKRLLSIYQYAAPVILAPLSFLLWRREYGGDLKLTMTALLIPILWAYIVPGIGTNVLHVWEFDTRLRLGRFRPHHGFVFGSATAMIAWLIHGSPANTLWDIVRLSLILCAVIGFCNVLYDVKALQSGILRVYNQPWANGRRETAIALDYAPWFFGGFGAVYGAGLGLMEWIAARRILTPGLFSAGFIVILLLTLVIPTAGYVLQSIRRHGHWGTRPVRKQC
ncbi:MAG: hypothetical protein QOK37_2554 [Thermoanaerobaculia bacterium]|jgi:hypothetical protein|nr:hypothetical protein [Thermoanaerobaculia bacterium]